MNFILFLLFNLKQKEMSFFTKIKDTLGIGGVKIKLDVAPQFPKTDGVISGKINLSTK